MSGTYKFYIGRCRECDKEDYYPLYLYKHKTKSKCKYCGDIVYIDKTETFEDKK